MFKFPTNVKDLSIEARVSQTTIYNTLKRLNYEPDVLQTNKRATWKIYASLSPDNLEELMCLMDLAFINNRELRTKLDREQ